MKEPKFPIDEDKRLNAVQSYRLLDTLPEEEYDDITNLIANVCDTPISLVTILDAERNFLKSHHGVPFNESPRNTSFCGHAILEPGNLFIVEDTSKDERFKDNPIVAEHGISFYAGAPLRTHDNYALGTLCIFDTKPRTLSEKQKKVIVAMAKQVMNLFELHKKNIQLSQIHKSLKERNENLKNFANLVSHDLKSPLANITSLARMLKEEYEIDFDENGNQYIDYIEESSETLKGYIDGMLDYYKNDEILEESKTEIKLATIYESIEDILFVDNAEFEHPDIDKTLYVNKAALKQIFINLVGNALKYNHHDIPHVITTFKEDDHFYEFTVQDNGIGIDKQKQEIIFDLFKTTGEKDRHGNTGSGIGLATVKNLVTKMGGAISLDSDLGKGTTFTFTIKK